MPLVAWAGIALGLLVTVPEAWRLHRRYGILLAGLAWPFLSAIVAAWVFAATVNHYNFGSPHIPIYFHVWHLVMIVAAPAVAAVVLGRKYTFSAGIIVGGALLAFTFFFWVSMLFGYGTSGATGG